MSKAIKAVVRAAALWQRAQAQADAALKRFQRADAALQRLQRAARGGGR